MMKHMPVGGQTLPRCSLPLHSPFLLLWQIPHERELAALFTAIYVLVCLSFRVRSPFVIASDHRPFFPVLLPH